MPTAVQSFLIDYSIGTFNRLWHFFFSFFARSLFSFDPERRSEKRRTRSLCSCVTIKSRSGATVPYRPFLSANWSGQKFRSTGPSQRRLTKRKLEVRGRWQKAFFFLYLFAPAAQSQDVFVISRTEAAPLPLPSSYVGKFFATLPARC